MPKEGVPQTVYYENPDNGNTIVKFRTGGQAVTSHSKTDSFGRKVFDELQLDLGFVSGLVVNGRSTGHWLAETQSALSITMTLKYKGRVIATYKPSAKQWWITSFNPLLSKC